MTKNSRSRDDAVQGGVAGVVLLTSWVRELRQRRSPDFAMFVKSPLQSVVMGPVPSTPVSAAAPMDLRRVVRLVATVLLVVLGAAGLVGAGFAGGEVPSEARVEAGVSLALAVAAAVTVPQAARRHDATGGGRAVSLDIVGHVSGGRRPADPPTSSVLRRGPPVHAPTSFVLA